MGKVHKETMTISEAAEMLGVSRTLAYKAASTGDIPALRIGNRLVVPTRRLLKLLDDQEPSSA